MTETDLKREKLRLLEKKLELIEGLPHLYRWKNYAWATKFIHSENQMAFLCAGNQVSKSSSLIRRMILRATSPKLWPKLWRTRPHQFWYLLPTMEQATIEFEKKWVPEFLPAGKYKDDPIYGWKDDWKGADIRAIHFNTGISIFFKSYAQDPSHLQSGTVHEIGCDEELPEDLFSELQFRLAATAGYFSMVFTATLAQEFWREVIEERGPAERFPEALKLQISMWDCQRYEDGTPSIWTPERIRQIENRCASQKEIDKRVHGKFVKDEGLRFECFEKEKNVVKPFPIPPTWRIYSGVDIGAGGEKQHPAAITFCAVRPDMKKAAIFRGWRGDKIVTTASDILNQYRIIRGPLIMSGQYYDYASRDFFTIATRAGEAFQPADKSNAIGETILNTLFRNRMLDVFDLPELQPLIRELLSLRVDVDKRKRKDDFADSCRYAVSKIPFDFSVITGDEPIILPKAKGEVEQRREAFETVDLEVLVDDEIDAWNELYDA